MLQVSARKPISPQFKNDKLGMGGTCDCLSDIYFILTAKYTQRTARAAAVCLSRRRQNGIFSDMYDLPPVRRISPPSPSLDLQIQAAGVLSPTHAKRSQNRNCASGGASVVSAFASTQFDCRPYGQQVPSLKRLTTSLRRSPLLLSFRACASSAVSIKYLLRKRKRLSLDSTLDNRAFVLTTSQTKCTY